jgi:hypothetical protein
MREAFLAGCRSRGARLTRWQQPGVGDPAGDPGDPLVGLQPCWDVTQSEPARVILASYDPTGEVWWITLEKGDLLVRRGSRGEVMVRGPSVDVNVSEPPNGLLFAPDMSSWAMRGGRSYPNQQYLVNGSQDVHELPFAPWRKPLDVRQLTNFLDTNYRVGPGAYAEDGTRFAFMATSPAGQTALFVAADDGSEPRRVGELSSANSVIVHFGGVSAPAR